MSSRNPVLFLLGSYAFSARRIVAAYTTLLWGA